MSAAILCFQFPLPYNILALLPWDNKGSAVREEIEPNQNRGRQANQPVSLDSHEGA